MLFALVTTTWTISIPFLAARRFTSTRRGTEASLAQGAFGVAAVNDGWHEKEIAFFSKCWQEHSVNEASKDIVVFDIEGEPASKANSRRIVRRGKRLSSIKSEKAIDYVETFRKQCPRLIPPLECLLHLDITIWYASWRPDLDESLILDAMQGLVFVNDRQVVSKHVVRRIDRDRPRSRIHVSSMEGFPVEDVPRHPRPKKKNFG